MFPNKTFLNGKRKGQFIKATCRKEEERGKLMKEHSSGGERTQIDGTGLVKFYL